MEKTFGNSLWRIFPIFHKRIYNIIDDQTYLKWNVVQEFLRRILWKRKAENEKLFGAFFSSSCMYWCMIYFLQCFSHFFLLTCLLATHVTMFVGYIYLLFTSSHIYKNFFYLILFIFKYNFSLKICFFFCVCRLSKRDKTWNYIKIQNEVYKN